jgi:predicted  nucleic acid-binding Zn-ribbon protein
MTEQIENLKRMQQLDGELYQLRRQQLDKPLELAQAKQRVAAQEAKVKASDDALKALQMAQKDKEGDLQSREASVKKLQSQLFQLKTNKEYSTMQHEIEALKADNSLIEEGILKLFDQVEAAARARQQEQQALAAVQEQYRSEEKRVQQDLSVIAQRIGELEQARSGVAPSLPQPTLEVYQRILSMRNGLALVPLARESCGGCHRRLPPQVVNEVMIKAKLVTCENCNRILFADDGTNAV